MDNGKYRPLSWIDCNSLISAIEDFPELKNIKNNARNESLHGSEDEDNRHIFTDASDAPETISLSYTAMADIGLEWPAFFATFLHFSVQFRNLILGVVTDVVPTCDPSCFQSKSAPESSAVTRVLWETKCVQVTEPACPGSVS